MTNDPNSLDTKAEGGVQPAGVRVTAPKCVRCKQPVQARYRPFCSQRCMDADLGAWVSGAYSVATADGPGPHSEEDGQEEQ